MVCLVLPLPLLRRTHPSLLPRLPLLPRGLQRRSPGDGAVGPPRTTGDDRLDCHSRCPQCAVELAGGWCCRPSHAACPEAASRRLRPLWWRHRPQQPRFRQPCCDRALPRNKPLWYLTHSTRRHPTPRGTRRDLASPRRHYHHRHRCHRCSGVLGPGAWGRRRGARGDPLVARTPRPVSRTEGGTLPGLGQRGTGPGSLPWPLAPRTLQTWRVGGPCLGAVHPAAEGAPSQRSPWGRAQ